MKRISEGEAIDRPPAAEGEFIAGCSDRESARTVVCARRIGEYGRRCMGAEFFFDAALRKSEILCEIIGREAGAERMGVTVGADAESLAREFSQRVPAEHAVE